MEKKYLFTMAAAAAMLAACSDDAKELSAPELQTNPTEEVAQGTDIPVLFDSYVNRATTRTGATGDTDDDAIKKPFDEGDPTKTYGGFGVFGYYTDNNEYDQLATPNFFYNQRVTYATDHWTYEPVKYWPNEYGTSAVSDDADKVTYFAYAPYVDVTPSSGKVTTNNNENGDATWGITGMTRNTAAGDPVIKYIGSFDNRKSVDLVWGVNKTTSWPRVVDGSSQTFTAGLPWLNVERPAQAQKIGASEATQNVQFQFLHALAKMKFKIDAFVDGTDGSNDLDSKTKIWVRSVRFTGFAMKGALNLNNETANEPYWMNYNGNGDLESGEDVIVYDGRKDGKEGVSGSDASNEKSLGLNAQLIETEASFGDDGAWASSGEHYTGVTKTAASLFNGTGTFFAIPTDEDLTVEIVYDVETIDSSLGTRLADNLTPGSSIENRISKKISFGSESKLKAGKQYVVNLHLGMNDVNFDAQVLAWEAATPAEADLPANVPFYAAKPASDNAIGAATIPYNATSFTIGISGLYGGEAISAELVDTGSYSNTETNVKTSNESLTGWSVSTVTNANTSGYQVETITTAPNTLTTNRVQVAEWTGGTSGNKVTMTFTQLAAPLALKAPATLTADTDVPFEYQLNRAGANYGFFCTGIEATTFATLNASTNDNPDNGANGIKVYRNGNELTLVDTLVNEGDFTFNDTGMITVKENFVADDVIKVVLKTGDAPAETISWKVE